MMLSHDLCARTRPPRFQPIGRGAQADMIHQEKHWRTPEDSTGSAHEEVLVSRWTDLRDETRHVWSTTPSDRYVIAIALRTTRLTLTREGTVIFDGVMPVGALHVTRPSTRLRAHFRGGYDFLHFFVSVDDIEQQDGSLRERDKSDLILLRDPLAEQLAKALVDIRGDRDRQFATCIGQALAAHIARLEVPRSKANALPKWRLRLVEDYVRATLHRSIGLADLAKAAGLSRMHFAAQFRAATGYRPREYLLHQRIDRAKSILSNGDTPLAEIALAVGFSTQAHFSTVFKHITGDTPARWRCARRSERAVLAATSRGGYCGDAALLAPSLCSTGKETRFRQPTGP